MFSRNRKKFRLRPFHQIKSNECDAKHLTINLNMKKMDTKCVSERVAGERWSLVARFRNHHKYSFYYGFEQRNWARSEFKAERQRSIEFVAVFFTDKCPILLSPPIDLNLEILPRNGMRTFLECRFSNATIQLGESNSSIIVDAPLNSPICMTIAEHTWHCHASRPLEWSLRGHANWPAARRQRSLSK